MARRIARSGVKIRKNRRRNEVRSYKKEESFSKYSKLFFFFFRDEIARHRRRSEVLSYELNTVKGEKEEVSIVISFASLRGKRRVFQYERRTVELSNAQTRLKRIVAEVEGRASAASRQVNENHTQNK